MNLKQGDTFSLDGLLADDAGAPIDLTDYSLTSQVRRSEDPLVATLTITKANQTTDPGVFTMAAASTDDWPVGALTCDVRVVDDASAIRHSATFVINVLKAITRP